MSAITTHVLDLSTGHPARGVAVHLELRRDGAKWVPLADRKTDDDGRVKDFLAEGARLDPGIYRLTFQTGDYFERWQTPAFHPEVTVVFRAAAGERFHVPLLVSPFGYTTYRGS
jgi:5-hydroxyisourate hydrolase